MAKRATKVEKKEKPKKEKKTKAKKDKNAPKRAISAFFFYQKERRETLKKEQPDLDNKQLISTMSREWNEMKDPQRAAFNKSAEQDKARYEREKKDYEKTKGSSVSKPTPKKEEKTHKKTPIKPKKHESEDEEENDDE
jgi:hypothetical protein